MVTHLEHGLVLILAHTQVHRSPRWRVYERVAHEVREERGQRKAKRSRLGPLSRRRYASSELAGSERQCGLRGRIERAQTDPNVPRGQRSERSENPGDDQRLDDEEAVRSLVRF